MAWQQFERDCFQYIAGWYSQFKSIKAFGNADSTKADIEITTNSDAIFFVETKEENAQCGQFVLFPNETSKTFDFSKDNRSVITNNCANIIAAMDADYNRFCNVGSAGIPINIDKSVLYGWVNDVYSLKNVKYFITKGNEYIIFPRERLAKYFDIEAFYRRKPSGSSEPNPGPNSREIEAGLRKEGILGKIEFAVVGGKRRCFLDTQWSINEKRMVCDHYTYQFKNNEYAQQVNTASKFVYEVRRLSNTSNPNVICQLTLKTHYQVTDDLAKFEAEA